MQSLCKLTYNFIMGLFYSPNFFVVGITNNINSIKNNVFINNNNNVNG